MSSSAALASAAEPAMSTVKPTSPSFDFKMPERRSSSSMTRRRNDNPPPRDRWGAVSFPTSSLKFNTVLGHRREGHPAPFISMISALCRLLVDRSPVQSVKTALKVRDEPFEGCVPREERNNDPKSDIFDSAGCDHRVFGCASCPCL